MVIRVSHLTNQGEITGGGHARILSAVRGPAFPPAGPPTPVAASDSCTLTPLRGYDDPFQFHIRRQLAKRFMHEYYFQLEGGAAWLWCRSRLHRLQAIAIASAAATNLRASV